MVKQGHEVFGLHRSLGAEADFKLAGIKPLTADITKTEQLAQLPGGYDWVVNCVSASGGGAEEYLAGRAALVSQDDVAMLRERVYEVAAEIDRGSGHWPENTRRWSDWFQRTYSRDGEIREVCRIARQLGA